MISRSPRAIDVPETRAWLRSYRRKGIGLLLGAPFVFVAGLFLQWWLFSIDADLVAALLGGLHFVVLLGMIVAGVFICGRAVIWSRILRTSPWEAREVRFAAKRQPLGAVEVGLSLRDPGSGESVVGRLRAGLQSRVLPFTERTDTTVWLAGDPTRHALLAPPGGAPLYSIGPVREGRMSKRLAAEVAELRQQATQQPPSA